jgi:hypothetical protein
MIQAAQHAFRNSRAQQWLTPILREQPYNGTFKWDRRASDLRQVLEMVLADIGVWSGYNARA